LRPGRFDRLIFVPEPDEDSRLKIFTIHTKSMPLSKDVNLKELAARARGYSGADIASVCREAGMNALRRDINANIVTIGDFGVAIEKVPPSISPDMEKWYMSFMRQIRKVQKPAPLVA